MIILKIVLTIVFLLMLLCIASFAMMIFEGKREKLWFRTASVSAALMALITAIVILVMVWTDN